MISFHVESKREALGMELFLVSIIYAGTIKVNRKIPSYRYSSNKEKLKRRLDYYTMGETMHGLMIAFIFSGKAFDWIKTVIAQCNKTNSKKCIVGVSRTGRRLGELNPQSVYSKVIAVL